MKTVKNSSNVAIKYTVVWINNFWTKQAAMIGNAKFTLTKVMFK
jgi:hypothetical protein